MSPEAKCAVIKAQEKGKPIQARSTPVGALAAEILERNISPAELRVLNATYVDAGAWFDLEGYTEFQFKHYDYRVRPAVPEAA